MILVREYIDEKGVNRVKNFLDKVKDKVLLRKINTRVIYIECGNLGNHRNLPGGIGEIIIDYGPGIRIYYGQDGPYLILLLHANIKGSKREQNADIKLARSLWCEYLERRGKKYD